MSGGVLVFLLHWFFCPMWHPTLIEERARWEKRNRQWLGLFKRVTSHRCRFLPLLLHTHLSGSDPTFIFQPAAAVCLNPGSWQHSLRVQLLLLDFEDKQGCSLRESISRCQFLSRVFREDVYDHWYFPVLVFGKWVEERCSRRVSSFFFLPRKW